MVRVYVIGMLLQEFWARVKIRFGGNKEKKIWSVLIIIVISLINRPSIFIYRYAPNILSKTIWIEQLQNADILNSNR